MFVTDSGIVFATEEDQEQYYRLLREAEERRAAYIVRHQLAKSTAPEYPMGAITVSDSTNSWNYVPPKYQLSSADEEEILEDLSKRLAYAHGQVDALRLSNPSDRLVELVGLMSAARVLVEDELDEYITI